jgi:hypothetical protein
LLAKGYTSQVEISRILNISESSVSRDIDYLKQAAQRSLKEHIELRIPHQYSICETGLKIVLRRAYDIANNPNNTTSENIQSLSLIANIYGRLMELSTDEKTIAQAVSWIERKKEQLMQEGVTEGGARGATTTATRTRSRTGITRSISGS